jgi:hypothetical protein
MVQLVIVDSGEPSSAFSIPQGPRLLLGGSFSTDPGSLLSRPEVAPRGDEVHRALGGGAPAELHAD